MIDVIMLGEKEDIQVLSSRSIDSMLHEDDDNETSLLYIALVHTYSAKEIPSQCLLYHERRTLHLFIRGIAPVN